MIFASLRRQRGGNAARLQLGVRAPGVFETLGVDGRRRAMPNVLFWTVGL